MDSELVDIEKFRCLLRTWDRRAYRSAAAHYKCAGRYFLLSRLETIINALLSIVILFLTNAFWVRDLEYTIFGLDGGPILTSLSAVGLVILTMLQFLLRHEARAFEHKVAAPRFSNVSRKIERYSCKSKPNMGGLHAISRRYSDITTTSPTIPAAIWKNPAFKSDDVFATCHGMSAQNTHSGKKRVWPFRRT